MPGTLLDVLLGETMRVGADDGSRLTAVRQLIRPAQVAHINIAPGNRIAAAYVTPAQQVAAWLQARLQSGALRYVAEPPTSDFWQTPRLTLRLGTGDCEDFSVLVAALLRHHGLEAGVVTGFLWTRQGWIGHAWVEGTDRCGAFLIEATSGALQRIRARWYHAQAYFSPQHYARLDQLQRSAS